MIWPTSTNNNSNNNTAYCLVHVNEFALPFRCGALLRKPLDIQRLLGWSAAWVDLTNNLFIFWPVDHLNFLANLFTTTTTTGMNREAITSEQKLKLNLGDLCRSAAS